MLKVMAILRTLFLVFIAGYTIRAMPLFTTVAKTFDEQYARCSTGVELLTRAAWIAIAWIGLETVIGWVVAIRRGKQKAAAAARVPTV